MGRSTGNCRRQMRRGILPMYSTEYSSRRGAAQKIRHQSIEPIRLIPMHPMRAVVENMEFRAGQGFQQQDRAFDGCTMVVGAPKKHRRISETVQFAVERTKTARRLARLARVEQRSLAHLIAFAYEFVGHEILPEEGFPRH